MSMTVTLPSVKEKLFFEENSFTAKNYLSTALLIGSFAAILFPFCFPVSVTLFAISCWYLFSATIVVLNRLAEDTPLARPIHFLHGAMTEINTAIKAASLFPFTFFDSYHLPLGEKKGRPILLINGYLSFGSTWDYHREKLKEAGFGPIYTMNVGSFRSIDTYANYVAEKAKKIREETGRDDLVLIGHSKGGLVSSHFATTLAEANGIRVTDVITIGSPLAGTHIAYAGPGLDALEMRPESPFNTQLRTNMISKRHIRFSHIASEVDLVVPDKHSALPKGENCRHYIIKDLGHLALVFSSRVSDQVCAWLKEVENLA